MKLSYYIYYRVPAENAARARAAVSAIQRELSDIIGIGGRLKDLIAGSRGPGIELRATLARPDGRVVGSVSLRTSRLFVAVSPRTGKVLPHPFIPRSSGRVPRGIKPLPPVRITWTLELKSGARVSARICTLIVALAPGPRCTVVGVTLRLIFARLSSESRLLRSRLTLTSPVKSGAALSGIVTTRFVPRCRGG